MKKECGWWFPDRESHMIEYMKSVNVRYKDRLSYQPEKIDASLRECSTWNTAVDVGAHVGTWSFRLSEKFKTVHSFEPLEEHCECFFLNAPNAILHKVALGKNEGHLSIVKVKDNSGMAYVSLENEGTKVPVKTLDSFNLEDVGFIKIDCEGYENNVLLGSIETIKRCKPVICVEQKHLSRHQNGRLDAVTTLEGLGYKTKTIISGDYIMVPND